MYMSKASKEKIAALFNGIQVAEDMAAKAQAQGDKAMQYQWLANAAEAHVELGDHYGIYLPCYEQAVEELPRYQAMAKEYREAREALEAYQAYKEEGII